ncbi:MAG: diacylglycerol kinase family protein [Chloroflexota bacterium]
MSETSTHALVIYNPAAGQSGNLTRDLNDACAFWRSHGWRVDLQPTTAPGDGPHIARAAARRGYNVIVAAGGDGTVNEVINGLVGTEAALAVLPIGTVNIWARELGIPLQTRAAAEAILYGQVRQVDLGRANDRYFLLMAGVGFDAAVTAEVGSKEKRLLGVFAYAFRAIQLAWRFQGVRTHVIVDGKPIHGRILMVVVGNSRLYGGFVKLTVRATINDGLLDVCVIKGKTLRGAPSRILSIITRRYHLDSEVEYHRAQNVEIRSSKPLPVQVDGDYIGHTPMSFEAIPSALRAIMPETLPEDLLRTETPPSQRSWRRFFGSLRRWRYRQSHIETNNQEHTIEKRQS